MHVWPIPERPTLQRTGVAYRSLCQLLGIPDELVPKRPQEAFLWPPAAHRERKPVVPLILPQPVTQAQAPVLLSQRRFSGRFCHCSPEGHRGGVQGSQCPVAGGSGRRQRRVDSRPWGVGRASSYVGIVGARVDAVEGGWRSPGMGLSVAGRGTTVGTERRASRRCVLRRRVTSTPEVRSFFAVNTRTHNAGVAGSSPAPAIVVQVRHTQRLARDPPGQAVDVSQATNRGLVTSRMVGSGTSSPTGSRASSPMGLCVPAPPGN